jgi:hypothetical protein
MFGGCLNPHFGFYYFSVTGLLMFEGFRPRPRFS